MEPVKHTPKIVALMVLLTIICILGIAVIKNNKKKEVLEVVVPAVVEESTSLPTLPETVVVPLEETVKKVETNSSAVGQ